MKAYDLIKKDDIDANWQKSYLNPEQQEPN